ncbi:hypothetical protein OBBRIDRAFT_780167 [Obba rivulosa]|uniref:Uncharacterized protein n=1 Tax=Obba rivulosa TaxID=1052685 RepID=A0A8E2AXH0_9APHY|nr:hypothetical protein OBBRIDRAFT_780167 [Obba rivulosa]
MADSRHEASWEQLLWGSPTECVYTRPLLGSELLVDQLSVFEDGLADCCMGFKLTTSLSRDEFHSRVLDAMARLRFVCPVIASSIERGVHDPQLRSWVYVPVKDAKDLQEWLEQVVIVLDEIIDPESFVTRMSQNTLPYLLSNGRKQVFRCYIFKPTDAPNSFAIYFHGVHAIMDAKPTLNAFSLLFQWVANPEPHDIMELEWGSEWTNLPAGPIAATGGPRPSWDTDGQSLLAKVMGLLMDPVPSHSLQCQRSVANIKGKPFRLHTTFSEADTANIMHALKAAKFSPTHLLDAVTALAIFALKPVSDADIAQSHVTHPVGIISLSRWFVPSINTRAQFISSMVLVPIQLRWMDLYAIEDEKMRLMEAMRLVKAQYDDYLANPHIPHLTAELMRIAAPREPQPSTNACVTTPTNLGVVEQTIPTEWHSGGDTNEPVLSLQDLSFGHRTTNTHP